MYIVKTASDWFDLAMKTLDSLLRQAIIDKEKCNASGADTRVCNLALELESKLTDINDEILGEIAVDELPDDFLGYPLPIVQVRYSSNPITQSKRVDNLYVILDFLHDTLAMQADSQYFSATGEEVEVVTALESLRTAIDVLSDLDFS